MKKKIVFGVLLAVFITVVVGTYMYRHRFDKYEQSQEEQAAGILTITMPKTAPKENVTKAIEVS